MPFTTISSSAIEAGDPVTQDLWSTVKDDLDNHETRILANESALQKFRPIELEIYGVYAAVVPITGAKYTRINFNTTLTAAVIFIPIAGSAGTTQVDVLYKRGAGAYTSIFSTKPSVAFGAGDNAISSNAVLSTTALLSGDFLRFDVLTAQTGQDYFSFQLDFYPT